VENFRKGKTPWCSKNQKTAKKINHKKKGGGIIVTFIQKMTKKTILTPVNKKPMIASENKTAV